MGGLWVEIKYKPAALLVGVGLVLAHLQRIGVFCPSRNLGTSLISMSEEGTGVYRLGAETDVVIELTSKCSEHPCGRN